MISLGVFTVLGVLLILSRTHTNDYSEQQPAQQDSATADLHHHQKHAGASVSVFESSMHTGARLDQGFPSPANLKEACSKPSDDDDSSSDDDSDNSEDDSATCPGRGSGTVVVESKEKLQKVIGFGGAFTDAATINFYKLPPDVQEKVREVALGMIRRAYFFALFLRGGLWRQSPICIILLLLSVLRVRVFL